MLIPMPPKQRIKFLPKLGRLTTVYERVDNDFITNMVTSEFSNVMLNASDFVAKTVNVVIWDNKRATMEVF